MIPNPYSGIFIVFEGINGSGKSTQVELTENWLRKEVYLTPTLHSISSGRVVEVFKEPDKSLEYGERIYQELYKGEDGLAMQDPAGFQTWYACNSKLNLERNVIPRLKLDGIVLQDRFRPSLVHGASSVEDIDRLMLMNRIIIGEHFIWPDVIFIINTSVEAAMERLKEKGVPLDAQEDRSEQRRTAKLFLAFAQKFPNCILVPDSGIKASIQEKHEFIKEHLRWLIKKKSVRGV